MIGPRTQFLLSIASGPLEAPSLDRLHATRLGEDLEELLRERNGFFAFESALFVRGFGPGAGDLLDWNSASGWRAGYGADAAGLFFFAEDLFGGQFAIDGEEIVRFDPETGARVNMASSVEDFADQMLDEYAYLTGYPLAKKWQALHGPLLAGQRLIPVQPFVLGGAFSLENLQPMADESAMRLRSELARQIRDFPDGTQIRLTPGQ